GKYHIGHYMRAFPTERGCIDHLVSIRFTNGITCPKCAKVTAHYLIEKRKCYQCKECGNQFYPTEGTIFFKSRTPLRMWFYVIYQMGQTRTGVAAREIERELGVTHKTAWRMCQLIRAALPDKRGEAFTGTAEVDDTYVRGKPRYKGQSRGK